MTKELLLFHVKIMFYISQRYESVVELNKSYDTRLGETHDIPENDKEV
jgi:hypothetical protein